ncbi:MULTISPECIES: peptidoglycan D,D-transpeptidase FtsI family protein [Prochlorococcus]|uniref:Cell division protein FtsI/penicillin-binding protein 2 n=1 Tax=Prochlorococcus marinus (strain SARG / CCMP1375 / SS120) TaxID=167539 RepID=Q7VD65_PROMA|nr:MULTISPECIES: penicillin-binding protein 2 [Prochlorococcus]AAP99563.1 Cell division protein FtsI/penicillin-binding protein 2 [Prochlorococcus marinus subsp. marinus str. CCMP1375]KGG11165.1 Cell division protein FtsI (Peptidoglycan synthetase) [Prochlorococcus marinus str. LG]KGG21503.1 Cell division protein FtsI (Peptidoglycan synthetase) [Prochlorococcus marinus str. SS2]KGG23152.1 Cell division protein FtsI (Peptidoglycan synthetase) [Prochlorococcus marinus str. SS35]KGG33863.1 Cell d
MPIRRNQRSKIPIKKRQRVASLSPIPPYRLKLTFSILCLTLIGLMGRFAHLQLVQGLALEARARGYQTKKVEPIGKRRSIVDRRGRLLALDEKRFRIYAHPSKFKFSGDPKSVFRKPKEVAVKLEELLPISQKKMVEMFYGKKSGVKLIEGLNSDLAAKVQDLRINGLDLEAYPQRVYPQNDLFSNVVGFLDYDRVPQAGLELSLNKELSRREKSRSYRFGRDGTPFPNDIESGVFSVDDMHLQLTLDARLQEVALSALREQIIHWKAKKGVAIVMNVNNGELLALASTPTYDPNKYWNYSSSLYKEWSVQELFEPGSTFKPINLALALEEGVIEPNGTVYDAGVVKIGGWPLKNWDKKPNGLLGFGKVLQVSSNVGMVNIIQKLGPSQYWEWLNKLGLNKIPETDLPGAVSGHMKDKELFVKQPIHQAVASYGQGFSISPLKLVQLHALIANGGKLVTPHIKKDFSSEDLTHKNLSLKNKTLLSPEVTKTVLGWMESVVEEGSGKGVKIKNYRIGGKTGTADQTEDGINYNSKICSFVAVLPIEAPKFVVVVAVDGPQRPHAYGSTVAVPVAKKIIESLIVIERIPPRNQQVDFLSAKS